jgi:tripartite-type tricarboxylate transporter receptor subunit TctC
MLLLFGAAVGAAAAWAQQPYPARPVRLIVPFPAGGTTDTLARPVAREVESQLGRAVVVDNRSGANGLVGAELVSNAARDGYTMLWTTTSIVISQAITRDFPWTCCATWSRFRWSRAAPATSCS